MANPVLVEVTRGDVVESRHRGMVVVVDGDGKVVFEAGDVDAAVFPRSSCKAMQALPLMESGAGCGGLWLRGQGAGACLFVAFGRGRSCGAGARHDQGGGAR